jgi:hypothetical protein
MVEDDVDLDQLALVLLGKRKSMLLDEAVVVDGSSCTASDELCSKAPRCMRLRPPPGEGEVSMSWR